MSTTLTIHLDDISEARMRLFAEERKLAPEAVAQAAVEAMLETKYPPSRVLRAGAYVCPVCAVRDPNAYLRCNRPDCTDGRDPR